MKHVKKKIIKKKQKKTDYNAEPERKQSHQPERKEK